MTPKLVGRAAELVALRSALERTGCVTLVGAPGVGKTSLARQFASEERAVAWVDCERPLERFEFFTTIASALGVGVRSLDEAFVFAHVVQRLEVTGAVLVVDGVLSGAVREALNDVVLSCERARVVVCAHEPLRTPVEAVVEVPPLEVDDAVSLLQLRLGSSVTPEVAERLVRQTDGLPLAIELVASQVAALGVNVVQTANVRGEALERSIAAAVASLSDVSREGLFALSVVSGSFNAASAMSVMGVATSLDVLTMLTTASLVRAEPNETFRLLDTVRDFARRHARADVLEAASERWCAALAQPSVPRADDGATFLQLAKRRDDLLAAWRFAMSKGQREWALELARTVDPLLVTQGPGTVHREVLERTLELAGASGAPARALGSPHVDSSASSGANSVDVSNSSVASGSPHVVDASNSSVAISHSVLRGEAHLSIASERTVLDVRLALGRLEGLLGRHRRALQHFRHVHAAASALNDASRAGWAKSLEAYSGRFILPPGEVRRAATEAKTAARDTRDLRLSAMAEVSLGSLELRVGDIDAACTAFRHAVAAARLAKSPRQLGIALGNLGAALISSTPLEAGAHLAEARDCFASIGDQFHLARVGVDEVALSFRLQHADAETKYVAVLDALTLAGALDGELALRVTGVQLAQARGEGALVNDRLAALEALAAMSDDTAWPERIARLRTGALGVVERSTLRVRRDGRTVRLDGATLDFSRRGPLRRVLVALVEARLRGEALSSSQVQEAGWPSERMFPESAAARVYAAIKRLRALGLGRVLLTRDEGYVLSPEADVDWLE